MNAVAKDSAEDAATLNVPQIKYSSYDSLRCVANVSVSGVQGETRLSAVMDGTPISEVAVKRNMPKRLALRSGVHEYEFVIENAAGRNSVKKTLGCYPMKPFSVKILGNKHEHFPIPPKPPISGIEDVITKTLQFQIRVPENDVSFLNKVTVRQNGKVILQERLSQIQNLDYQIPVELKRGLKNRFDIEVIHKSGYTVKSTKVYEVKEMIFRKLALASVFALPVFAQPVLNSAETSKSLWTVNGSVGAEFGYHSVVTEKNETDEVYENGKDSIAPGKKYRNYFQVPGFYGAWNAFVQMQSAAGQKIEFTMDASHDSWNHFDLKFLQASYEDRLQKLILGDFNVSGGELSLSSVDIFGASYDFYINPKKSEKPLFVLSAFGGESIAPKLPGERDRYEKLRCIVWLYWQQGLLG